MSEPKSKVPPLGELIAVVTGAGSGVGEVVAKHLATQGCKVALVGRTRSKLERVKTAIDTLGGTAVAISCDVSKPEDVEGLKLAVLEHFGTPQLLFNGAGLHCELLPIAESTPSEWIKTLEVNSIGPYLTCRAFMADMTKMGWGRIINVSSAASLHDPRPIGSVYQLSKVTLNFFTRQLAVELEDTGVTANALHPGEVKTEMWSAIKTAASQQADARQNMLKWSKWVEDTGGDPPEKTAQLVLELLTPEADNINGQFLWIKDGLKHPMPSW